MLQTITIVGPMSENHFYKMHRFVWFKRMIFTIDVYPSQTDFGVMLANSRWEINLFSILTKSIEDQ